MAYTKRRTTLKKKRFTRSRYKVASRGPLYRRLSNARTARQMRVQRLIPFPETKFVKHKYFGVVDVPAASATGLCTQYAFRANSTYDPDYTGVGHQPLFRDEMVAMYDRYTVVYSKIEIVLDPDQAVNTHIYGIDLNHTAAVDTDLLSNVEQLGGTVSRPSDRDRPLKLVKRYSAPTEFKTTRKGIIGDDMQRIASGSNPSSDVARFFVFYACRLNAGATTASFRIGFKMTFWVHWSARKDAPQS